MKKRMQSEQQRTSVSTKAVRGSTGRRHSASEFETKMSASIAVHEELEPSEPPLAGAAAEPSQPELSQPGPSQSEPDPSPALSKKQLKKQQRRDHSQQSFAVKKKQKKEVRREAKRAVRDTKQAAWEAMTEEEQEAVRKQVESERAARETKNAATAAAAAAAGPAPTCVIDLDFDELMDEQEVRSLVQQMMYSYGANKRASRPLDLHLTSLGGRIEEQVGCNRRYPGCNPMHPGCSPVREAAPPCASRVEPPCLRSCTTSTGPRSGPIT